MRRVIAGLTVVGAATFGGLAGSASAVPPGLETKPAEVFTCDGGVTIVVFGGSGRSAWVGDTLHLATEFHVRATFTPTGGTPVEQSFDKVYGGGAGGDEIHCTAPINDVTPEGTFVGEVAVVATVVPGHR